MPEFNGFLAESCARMREGEPRAHRPRRIAQAENGKLVVWHIEQVISLQDKFKLSIIRVSEAYPLSLQ